MDVKGLKCVFVFLFFLNFECRMPQSSKISTYISRTFQYCINTTVFERYFLEFSIKVLYTLLLREHYCSRRPERRCQLVRFDYRYCNLSISLFGYTHHHYRRRRAMQSKGNTRLCSYGYGLCLVILSIPLSVHSLSLPGVWKLLSNSLPYEQDIRTKLLGILKERTSEEILIKYYNKL